MDELLDDAKPVTREFYLCVKGTITEDNETSILVFVNNDETPIKFSHTDSPKTFGGLIKAVGSLIGERKILDVPFTKEEAIKNLQDKIEAIKAS